jgi:hypothetical protein
VEQRDVVGADEGLRHADDGACERGLPVVVRVKVRVRVRVRVRDGACEGGLAVVVGRVLGDVAGELRHLVRVRVRA